MCGAKDLRFVEFGESGPDEMNDLLSLVYNDGAPVNEEHRKGKPGMSYYGAYHGGDLLAFYRLMPMDVVCGQAELRCGGIAMVAVHPAHRAEGVGKRLMEWSLANMRSQGFHLASLYAFSESYYRQFGYEVCGRRLQISTPMSFFPKVKSPMAVRKLPLEPTAELKACHEAHVRAHSGGGLRREAFWWKRLLCEHRTVYGAGSPLEAYAVLQHRTEFFAEQSIEEFVWTTRAGYDSMIGFFRGLGMNKSDLRWTEPSRSQFYARYLDHGHAVQAHRQIMYRVLAPSQAVAAVAGDHRFTYSLDDPVLGSGAWDGQGKEVATGEISFTPQTLVQALLGEPSLGDLVAMGLVAGNSQAALAALPPRTVYCLDFF